METIKNAIGLNTKENQQGQEPVSGVQGAGTAVEPFDGGNRQDDPDLGGKAPQHTQTDFAHKVIGSAGSLQESSAGIAKPKADTTESGKSDHNTPQAASPRADSESPSKKASIGSSEWFKTAMPGRKLRNSGSTPGQTLSSGDAQTQSQVIHNSHQKITFADEHHASSEKNQGGGSAWLTNVNPFKRRESRGSGDSAAKGYNADQNTRHETNRELPPNHLGSQVPTGQAKPAALGELPSFGQIDLEDRPRSTEEPEGQSPKQDRQRRASKIAPSENPSAIPTAGGIQLGQKATEDRRKS